MHCDLGGGISQESVIKGRYGPLTSGFDQLAAAFAHSLSHCRVVFPFVAIMKFTLAHIVGAFLLPVALASKLDVNTTSTYTQGLLSNGEGNNHPVLHSILK